MDDAELRAYLERLERAIRIGSERTDTRFDRIDRQFEQVDRRFEQIDQRFEQVDQQLEQLRTEFNGLKQHVDKRFEHFKELMAGHFEYVLNQINDRLDRLELHTS